MATQFFEFDETGGAVKEGAIRYVLMRPDVLMGTGLALGDIDRFVSALEESAFLNARASFEAYRAKGLLTAEDALEKSARFAARLGWGSWSFRALAGGDVEVVVQNSPFAAGAGGSHTPVCGAITGVLRAVELVARGKTARVEEQECAAQGGPACRFRISSAGS